MHIHALTHMLKQIFDRVYSGAPGTLSAFGVCVKALVTLHPHLNLSTA